MRVLGYARVSSAEQSRGTSLQDQQTVIASYAKARGLAAPQFFVEAESGIHEKLERREQMRLLLAAVQKGDLILCDKLDRWSRDPEFTYRSVREILAKGASFYAVGDAVDPSTSEGDTALGFRVLFAREEHKRIRQRMVGTRQALRDAGYCSEGPAPLGYARQDVKGPTRNIFTVNLEHAAIVSRIFKLCVGGKSLVAIGEAVGFSAERVASILRNRIYLGEIRATSGEWIPGRHPALVDARLFQDAADARKSRRNGSQSSTRGGATSTWWLRDVARCLCGAKHSSAYGGGNGLTYYFMCRAGCRPMVKVAAAEEACAPLVVARVIELKEELARPPAAIVQPVLGLESRLAKLDAKRVRLLSQDAEGLISREELREQLGKLAVERGKLSALAPLPALPPEARREALRSISFLTEGWRRMGPSERRKVVGILASSVGLSVGRPPSPVWKGIDELLRALPE